MTAFVNVFHSTWKPRPLSANPRCSSSRPAAIACTASSPALSAPRQAPRVSRAVVWFREGDLRLQDHPGLEAACEHTSSALAHLLVCTPRTSDATLEAAARLQVALIKRGSHLSVRFAHDEADAVVAFLVAFAAQRVHVRKDVESDARAVVDRVEQAVLGVAHVHTWVADLREWDALTDSQLVEVPDRFPAFLRWSLRKRAPVLPSTGDFEPSRIMPAPGIDTDPPNTIDAVSTHVRRAALLPTWNRQFEDRFQHELELTHAVRVQSDTEAFGEALLLTFLQQAERDELPDFARSLGEIFCQGVLSPRRMRQLVLQFERDNGRVLPLFFRDAAKTVLSVLDAREFSTLLARRDVMTRGTVDGVHEARFWRWNGFLIRYVEEGRHSKGAMRGTPPLLLIHGFGASCFHYEKSMRMLKERYHVFAIDLIGFGRSEKPPTLYSSAVWEAMIWDFVRDVIAQPVYVAGNSIGGYLACAFGTDAFRKTCAGICLINSAGRLSDSSAGEPTSNTRSRVQYWLRKWRWARMLIGRVLLRQLQGRITRTLNVVYPIVPLTDDSGLPDEIMRASLDYGAVEVIASGLIIPAARSLSRLLRDYDGPLLVFNGVLDPLGDVKTRTERLGQLYPSATIVAVQAGHCPHDEVAEQFAETMISWVEENEQKVSSRKDMRSLETR